MSHVSVPFCKMHGCRNDYIYFDAIRDGSVIHQAFGETLIQLASHIPQLCDRHAGIGADGVIVLLPAVKPYADTCQVQMRMFNADGSEAEMCGNGIRCLASLAAQRGYGSSDRICIQTK